MVPNIAIKTFHPQPPHLILLKIINFKFSAHKLNYFTQGILSKINALVKIRFCSSTSTHNIGSSRSKHKNAKSKFNLQVSYHEFLV